MLGTNPASIAVNQASNKIYVLINTSEQGSSIMAIDGFTESILAQLPLTAIANAGLSPAVTQIAANPVTGGDGPLRRLWEAAAA